MDFIDITKVTIGADPELFVKKGDEWKSGHAFPCGSKANPRRTGHGHVQNDGMALELNVPPAGTKRQFILNVRGVVHDLNDIVSRWDRECYLVAEPVAEFGSELIASVPKHYRELGCNPDFNAYSMEPNELPDAEQPFRTGAGHLHVGWADGLEGFEHFDRCARLVRQLDFTVGLRTLLIDDNEKRRKLYGKAGAFRPKPYGCEYRVPSNKWVENEEHAGIMFNGVLQGIRLLNEGVDLEQKFGNFAMASINTNNAKWPEHNAELAAVLAKDFN